MFDTNDLGKSFTLMRNPNWDPATDPNRKPLPDRIEVALNVNADDIDNRLLAGDLDVAIEGTGVGPAAQGQILADQALKANADSRRWPRGSGSRAINARRRAVGQRPLPQGGRSTRPTRPATSGPTAAPTGGDIATNLHAAGDPGRPEVRPLPDAGQHR